MAKLLRLLAEEVKVPEEFKDSFYQQLGEMVKAMLCYREPVVFSQALSAFFDWAKTTDLTDLNFMIDTDDVEL